MGKRRSLNAKPVTCNGKLIYRSKKEADGAAGRARRRSGHANIEAYPCKLKSHFHIGHQRPVEERRKLPLANGTDTELSGQDEGTRAEGLVAGRTTPLSRVGNVAGSIWATIETTEGEVP